MMDKINELVEAVNRMEKQIEKQKEQKPNVEICPHSVKSKSYSETGRSHFVMQVLSDGHLKKAIEIYQDECDCKAGDVVKAIIRKKD